MKALCITEPGKTALVERDEPTPGAGEVLLEVDRVGFCGSDLSTFKGKNPLAAYPRIPGHEIAATVAERYDGPGGEIPEGTRVTVVPYTNCGTCTSCLRGAVNACRYNQTLGVQREGAMAGYLAVPRAKLVVPRDLPPSRLVLVEPLTVGFHAVDRGRITDADTVLVIGCGMIGMGAIIRASLRGARVVVADIDATKLETAKTFGAEFAVDSKSGDLHEALSDLTGGNGPDVVIEAVGSPGTYRSAVEEVAFAGRIVCIGYAAQDAPLATRLFVQKELEIRGSRNATALDFHSAVRYLESATAPVESLVTRTVSLADAGKALADWAADASGIMKIVVKLG